MYNEEDIIKRNEAASNIQRISRGRIARKIAAHKNGERRVVRALQVLMAELSNPGLAGAGSSVLQVITPV